MSFLAPLFFLGLGALAVQRPGFWLFKEFFNLSVIEAIKTRTSYTTVLSILGLGGVLALSAFVG